MLKIYRELPQLRVSVAEPCSKNFFFFMHVNGLIKLALFEFTNLVRMAL